MYTTNRKFRIMSITDTGDTDSDSSCPSYYSAFPRKTSDWNKEHLHELNIFYQDKCTGLQDFLDRLKGDVRKFKSSIPESISGRLIDCTNDICSSSLNIYDKEFNIQTIDGIIHEIEELSKSLAYMNDEVIKSLDTENQMIFWAWRVNLMTFFTNLKKFVRRLINHTREACYTELLKTFTKICLLEPESGDVYKVTQNIKGLAIHSVPDVRYVSSSDEMNLVLHASVFLTEVEDEDVLRGEFNEESFCHENLSSRVLGQHGVELLIEAQDSCFWPRVAGIICVGTKVIFTYLDITKQHVLRIAKRRDKETVNHEARILYTKPYDFLDEKDRQEMLKILFWFGYVQSGGYKDFLGAS